MQSSKASSVWILMGVSNTLLFESGDLSISPLFLQTSKLFSETVLFIEPPIQCYFLLSNHCFKTVNNFFYPGQLPKFSKAKKSAIRDYNLIICRRADLGFSRGGGFSKKN